MIFRNGHINFRSFYVVVEVDMCLHNKAAETHTKFKNDPTISHNKISRFRDFRELIRKELLRNCWHTALFRVLVVRWLLETRPTNYNLFVQLVGKISRQYIFTLHWLTKIIPGHQVANDQSQSRYLVMYCEIMTYMVNINFVWATL